ncbi:hypothetical protein GGX14DRAFT_405211 [Mycena pura]|uniref:Uncharacterized protein n=1 Tax=Mycena pura TaxID=153505 RepID=A0AAD6USZ1_9AGAR|nr:hypothetical protein GGX14DRAFT_405211 [Mycena pura]
MIQTILESPVQVPATLLVGQKSEFPKAWLHAPANGHYVIERAQWNTVEDPRPNPAFSVKWGQFSGTCLLMRGGRGVEIAGVVLDLYFGIKGCIIPIGCVPDAESNIFAFTLAGPPDAAGKKDFYIMAHPSSPKETSLSVFSPGFSSVSDFHLNRQKFKPTVVTPCEGGEETVMARFYEFNLRQKPLDDGDKQPVDDEGLSDLVNTASHFPSNPRLSVRAASHRTVTYGISSQVPEIFTIQLISASTSRTSLNGDKGFLVNAIPV